jgi:hypothetical protein
VSAPTTAPGPALSAILSVPDTFETIRRTVGHLARQTMADRVELVIVCPDRGALNEDLEVVAPLHSMTVVERPQLRSVAHGNAEGVRAAHAEVVVLCEDHSFPEPDWAEALVRRHAEGRWQVVGPAVLNGNPEKGVSRADYLIGYGRWAQGRRAGPASFLPGHNSSYRRATLVDLGDELEAALSSEVVLHWRLNAAADGDGACYFEPAARTRHLNFGVWRSWLSAMYNSGRVFAANRASDWSPPTRLAWAAGAVLIPAVRLARTVRHAFAYGGPESRLLSCLPHLVVGLTVDGFGQLTGYALGAGRSPGRLAALEWHRIRHLGTPVRADP